MSKPNFSLMWAKFPKGRTAKQMYELIGGEVLALHCDDPDKYSNACALRMSLACNGSGLIIRSGKDDPGQRFRGKELSRETLSGRKYYAYYLAVAEMEKFFVYRFGPANKKITLFTRPNVKAAKNILKDRKGILLFRLPGIPGATGHLALWNGTNFADGEKDDYFSHSNLIN